jgi:hypothetical protein
MLIKKKQYEDENSGFETDWEEQFVFVDRKFVVLKTKHY